MPGIVETRLTLAKKKNMPDAVMTNGTISGEIIRAMTVRRKGMCSRLKPRAASVPSVVASPVAAMAIMKLLMVPTFHLSVHEVHSEASSASHMPNRDLYQSVEYPFGSSASMS